MKTRQIILRPYKAQKKVCNKEEVDAEKAKAKLKLETLQDDLYCKGQVEKARLCKVENKKNFGNIKKRHSNAKKKATTILEMALKATALARHDEEDDRGLVAWDAVAKTRSAHARVSNEAALAAVEYLEQTGYIYVKRQAKAILTSNDPDKVCFPASVVIQSTSMLTTLQENMRAAEQRMLEKKTGADCVAKEVEKLAHQERKENRIPCQSFEQLKGDKGVRLWFDPSETSRATREMNKVIVGQKDMIERLLIGLLGNGHILLEGVPGLAKTLAINSLSKAVQGSFSRVQFTPDLLPADVVGTMIYNMKENDFSIKKGPIFANFVLADEINRAPAKVQSALLEAMQERQITIGDTTFNLEQPFLVMATQNPVEQEGTYPLPEAQVDRFMLKTVIDYPKLSDEQAIMRQNLNGNFNTINPVVSIDQIIKAREATNEVYMDEKIEKYILDIIFATRYPERYNLSQLKPLISFGASPRGSINLAKAAKCYAFIKRRGYVIPEDVRAIVYDVLRHRIGITYEAEAENISSVDIINSIINEIEVP